MDSIQNLIKQAANDVGVNFREYSGRGMYGRQCIAVTGVPSELLLVLSAAVKSIMQEVFDTAQVASAAMSHSVFDEANNMVEMLHCVQFDTMGFDQVMYWPDIEPEDKVVSTDDEKFNEWQAEIASKLNISVHDLIQLSYDHQDLESAYDDNWTVDVYINDICASAPMRAKIEARRLK